MKARRSTAPSFEVKDCALITRMGGVPSAWNLRELRERVAACPIECIYHHFCETVIRPSFDYPEFRNDFAVWAAKSLRDRVLAERLGVINPYSLPDLEQVRSRVLEIIDERLSELDHFRWVPKGEDLKFQRAATVIFDTGIKLHTPRDLLEQLPNMSLSTIYYHYVEARRRTPSRNDDFSLWLADFGKRTKSLVGALAKCEFYFLSLPELKQNLVEVTRRSTRQAVSQ